MYASDLRHNSPGLEDKLHRLYTLDRDKSIDLSFRPPYLALLEALGNPHLNLPPVIHVAGTNGKGSTIALLRAILEAGGYKVHAYTSPHLQHFNERIVLAGEQIGDDMLEALIDEALELNNGAALTFFEITTAMAFAAFARTPADICLLETGLGGRLDCTNVIQSPLATIITSIGYDHTEFLGETLCEIAAEKAGIMKENAPCIIGAQSLEARESSVPETFKATARQKNAALFCCGPDWSSEPKTQGFMRFIWQGEETNLPAPCLQGTHQIANAGAALAALKAIETQVPLDETAYSQGLRNAQWPARLEKIERGALADLLPSGWSLYLDGGHNEDAAQALARQAATWQENDAKDLHLVLGMMKHKDPEAFLRPLLPHIASLTLLPITGEPQAFTSTQLKEKITITAGTPVDTPEQAITRITSGNQNPGRILICGSLYLAGEILHKNRKAP